MQRLHTLVAILDDYRHPIPLISSTYPDMKKTMSEQRSAVCAIIRKAFAGVILEEGIGLKEGQGLDDYEDQQVCNDYRNEDEKLDWAAIPPEKLLHCYSSLCFFDSKGMRFHLPAFLIAELEGTVRMGTDFHLTHLDNYAKNKLTLLSADQRAAVRAFLLEIRDDPEFTHEPEVIDQALATYWRDDSLR